jgi:hypothetical protein
MIGGYAYWGTAWAKRVFFALIAVMIVASPAFASESDALGDDGLSDQSEMTMEISGEITRDIFVGEGSSASFVGDLTIAKDVRVTFQSGSKYVFDPLGSVSVAGSGGSELIFEAGTILCAMDTQIDLRSEVALRIDGKISYGFSVQSDANGAFAIFSVSVDKGSTIGINAYEMSFGKGFSASARTVGSISDLISLISSGNDINMSLDISVQADGVGIKAEGVETTVSGSTSMNAAISSFSDSSKSGLVVKLKENGNYKFALKSQTIDYHSEADIILNMVSSDPDATSTADMDASISGNAKIAVNCSDVSLGDGNVLKGIDASADLRFSGDAVDAVISATASELSAKTLGYGADISLKDLSANGSVHLFLSSIMEIIQGNGGFSLQDAIYDDNFIANMNKALKSMGLQANLALSIGDAAYYLDEGNQSVFASAKDVAADLKYDYLSSPCGKSAVRAAFISAGLNSRTENQYVSFGNVDVQSSMDDDIVCSLSAETMILGNIKDGNGYVASGKKMFAETSVANISTMDLHVKGEIEWKQYMAGALASTINFDGSDAIVALSYDPDDHRMGYALKSAESNVVIRNGGITMDCGKAVYDPDSQRVVAADVSVSGRSVALNSVEYTVEGSIVNLRSDLEMNPSLDSLDLKYVMSDGSSMTNRLAVREGYAEQTVEVHGTVPYDMTRDPNTMIGLAAYLSTIDKKTDITITGDGRLVFDGYDDDNFDLKGGKAYLIDYFYEGNLKVDLSGLYGEYIVLNGSADDMGIEAKPGFTTVPSTYSGFSVVDGKVVLDESKISSSILELSSQPVGNKYVLTFDGTPMDVEYGKTIVRGVSSDTMWVADSDGAIYGSIADGSWEYEYDRLGDLSLKSVKGKEVKPESGRVVSSESDRFFFEPPGPGEVATIKTPSGLVFSISSDDLRSGDRFSVSVDKTEFMGNTAYDIEANCGASVLFPVSSEDAAVYHVVNGAPVEMIGNYLKDEDGRQYLDVELSSYSVYYVSEPTHADDGKSDPPYVAIAIVFIVAAIAGALLIIRKRN